MSVFKCASVVLFLGGFGILKLASSLQAEPHLLYNLTFLAYDLGRPSLTASGSILISVNGSINFSPKFDSERIHVRVPGDSALNSVILVVSAGNGDYYYRITGMT